LDKSCFVAWRSVLLIALLLLAACSSMHVRTPGRPALDRQSATHLYIARRGWHVDLGFATAELGAPLRPLATHFPDARYLMFGFGDRRYLLAGSHHGRELLQALWPGPGLLLLTGLRATPAEAFGAAHVITLWLNPAQALAVQDFLSRSLAPRALAGESDAAGPYGGSLFFGATEHYSALHTCNTWVAEALASAALPVESRGVVFAGQLWRQVARLAEPELRAEGAARQPP
jgi:hypothetical protein